MTGICASVEPKLALLRRVAAQRTLGPVGAVARSGEIIPDRELR